MLREAAVIGPFLDDRRLRGQFYSLLLSPCCDLPNARRRLSPSRCCATPTARRAPPDGNVAESTRARHRRRAGGRRSPARERRGGREEPAAAVRRRRHRAEPPADERSLARRPGRLDRSRPAVAAPPWRCDRGDTVERAGADPRPRAGAAARPRPARGRVRSGRPRPEAPPGRRLAAARRGAPGSAPRRGHREHVDVGGAVGRPAVTVAPAGGGERRGARRSVAVGAHARCEHRSRERVRRAPCIGGPGVRAAGAGRRSSPAARATTTAPPTGARSANPCASGCGSVSRPRRMGTYEG